MKQFVNRTSELKSLEKEYVREGASLSIIYGRRRIGKTTTIRKFIEGKKAMFFVANEQSEEINRERFKGLLADFLDSSLLKSAKFDSWEPVFEVLKEVKTDKKIIIVLDEFQYLGKINPAFPSIFQNIWDSMLKNLNVMFILCGSYITLMENQTIKESAPLYGRSTSQIKMKQISFLHYNDFYPLKKEDELIEFYAVTGGVPKYIEIFRGKNNLYDLITDEILNKNGFLYSEPRNLLNREVSEVGTYFDILQAIANGNEKLSKISAYLEVPGTRLTPYLRTLIDLDIIKREVPITEKNPKKSKSGLYRICDNYFRFWFLFINPYETQLEIENIDYVLNIIKRDITSSHIAYVYEDIAIEKLWRANKEGKFPLVFDKIGRWWNNNDEIDAVAIGKDSVMYTECKYWKDKKVGMNILEKLKIKSKKVPKDQVITKEYYCLFSIAGFTDELKMYAENEKNIYLFE